MITDRAASVLARLKNRAKKNGISYQQCLQLFFQEELLRKLSASRYKENLVLKGGLFIYILTNFESRATVDVDFMIRGLSNDMARMDEIIAEILAVPTGNDYIKFKAIPAEPIALNKNSVRNPLLLQGGVSTKDFEKILLVSCLLDIGFDKTVV